MAGLLGHRVDGAQVVDERREPADERRAALVGRFSSLVDDLGAVYSMPQETGHRRDLRELEHGTSAGEDGRSLQGRSGTAGRRPRSTASRQS
ncbi:hypothetical protein, partial [Clavibacter michiganensis]|uniref:hypothetical protein n=1 Tax=Clavibacter michiganensis TaxID=28447 RepID=UPI00292D5D74